jgi:hypothetical protein
MYITYIRCRLTNLFYHKIYVCVINKTMKLCTNHDEYLEADHKDIIRQATWLQRGEMYIRR